MLDVLLAAAVEVAHSPSEREWSVARPSRSAPSALRQAVTPPKGWEAFARCVEDRESGGNAGILNAGGSGAAGLFQFMPAWRNGLPYIVRERLVQFGMDKATARKVRVHLSSLGRIEKYPAVYQRIAFAEVLEDGEWEHWALAGSKCQGLVP